MLKHTAFIGTEYLVQMTEGIVGSVRWSVIVMYEACYWSSIKGQSSQQMLLAAGRSLGISLHDVMLFVAGPSLRVSHHDVCCLLLVIH
jgi:hypothetical protein